MSCPELKVLFAGERARCFGYSSAHLSLADCCPKTKSPFPNFPLTKRVLFFGAKGSANHLALLSLCHPVMLLQWPTHPSLSNRPQVTECWRRLTCILTALAASPWDLLVQTQKVGEFIFPFPSLGGIPHHKSLPLDKKKNPKKTNKQKTNYKVCCRK